jgi:Regulator of ribonuclease activity B
MTQIELIQADRKTRLEDVIVASVSTNGGSHVPEEEPDANILEHFLYFPDEMKAAEAATRLRTRGWTVQVSLSGGPKKWFVFATEHWPNEERFEQTRLELEQLAEELGRCYDGWGRPG